MFRERNHDRKPPKSEQKTWANLALVGALLGTGTLGTEAMFRKANDNLKPGINGHLLCIDGKPTGPYEINLNQREIIKIRGPEGGILGSFGYTDLVLGVGTDRIFVESGNIKPNTDPRITTRHAHLGWSNWIKYDATANSNGGVKIVFEATSC